MLELLISFLYVGLFSIGGGYATLPLIQEQIVELHGWLSYKEFTDIITISQMTPGPLAVNGSTFVGLRRGCRNFRLCDQRRSDFAGFAEFLCQKQKRNGGADVKGAEVGVDRADCVCRLGDRAVVLVCCQFVASDQRRAGP